jgi:Family of unknown function (DUF5397)
MNVIMKSFDPTEGGLVAAYGRYKRFGLHGPVYEIMEDHARQSERGPVVRVRVVESGEELSHRLESLVGDPQEHRCLLLRLTRFGECVRGIRDLPH